MSDGKSGASGSCLCGAVAFRIDGPLAPIVSCHCGMCRKQTGSTFPCTTIWRDSLSFSAEPGLKWYRSSETSRRGFCGECGSVLFFEDIGSERISVLAGALDGPTGLHVAQHIYVADKPDWYEIADGAAQFAQDRDDVPMPPRPRT
jgi:hypothetical protein